MVNDVLHLIVTYPDLHGTGFCQINSYQKSIVFTDKVHGLRVSIYINGGKLVALEVRDHVLSFYLIKSVGAVL